MKTIYLTLTINKSEINREIFENFTIINCYEILDKYNYNLLKDTNLTRVEYLTTEIIKTESNLIICDTNLNVEDILRLSENIKLSNFYINKIIVPNEIKRNKLLAEGQEMYKNHNRWIDFYPGQIEEVHNEFEMKIKNLKSTFENTETEILEI